MPKINHEIPDFKKKQSQFEKQLQSNKSAKEKVVPNPFTMTKREEEFKQSTLNMSQKLQPSDAKHKYKPNVDWQRSMSNFEAAKRQGEHMTVGTTSKAEAIRDMNLRIAKQKEEAELKQQKLEHQKRERYNHLKTEFQDKMRAFREEEESKIKERMGDSLITVDGLKDRVRQKQMDNK